MRGLHRKSQEADPVERDAYHAWHAYQVSKTQKLEPAGFSCHYCSTVQQAQFPTLGLDGTLRVTW